MACKKNEQVNYTVETSDSGVSSVYFGGAVFCSVHHLFAGGVDSARKRAKHIASILNKSSDPDGRFLKSDMKPLRMSGIGKQKQRSPS